MNDKQAAEQAQTNQPEFAIQKIYVKDISFEAPNTPKIFTEEWRPHVELEFNNNGVVVEPDIYEVTLNITVKAKLGDKVAFIVEVQQAGIFTIKNFPEKEIKPLLGSYCPNILFPYAREAVADIINRGGFIPLNLAPINFDALYQQYEQQQQVPVEKEKVN